MYDSVCLFIIFISEVLKPAIISFIIKICGPIKTINKNNVIIGIIFILENKTFGCHRKCLSLNSSRIFIDAHKKSNPIKRYRFYHYDTRFIFFSYNISYIKSSPFSKVIKGHKEG